MERNFKDRVEDLKKKIGDFQNDFRDHVTDSYTPDYKVFARTKYNDSIESWSTANCQQDRHEAIEQALVMLKNNGLLSFNQYKDLDYALADLLTVDIMLNRINNGTIGYDTQTNFTNFGDNSGFFMIAHEKIHSDNVSNDTTTNQNGGEKKSEESEKESTIEEVLNYCQEVDDQKKKKKKKKKNKHQDETKVDTNNIQTEQDTVVEEYKKSINEHINETMQKYGGWPKRVKPVISDEWLKEHCADESLNSISQGQQKDLGK